jgi:phosphonate transport system ATP-binding protein
MEMLRTLNIEHRLTVLVSLHQVDIAMQYCQRTIAMRRGKVVYDGPSAALTPALLQKLYGDDARELLDDSLQSDGANGANGADSANSAGSAAPRARVLPLKAARSA